MGEDGLLASLFGCCCGASGMGEELYKDWESHPACQQYNITKRLGEGGFSEVHLAHDKLTGKTVALKVVFLNKGGLTKDQKKILAGEARLVRMVAHPNVVRCMQVLETRRQQVLVLEYLSGGEMLKQLQRMKRYSEANACQMFKQVVDAVAYLHSLGILHRDIKPENCLLAKPASHYATKNKPVKVKLIDLGMAGLYRPNKPMQGCMGSPGFIAPEIILGEAHTPAMDVYSLGVLLFVMLVGRKPWDAQRSHTLAYAVQPTCEAPGLRDPVFGGLSAPAKQLLTWMLVEDPSRRPTAQQVLGHSWVLQGGMCKVEGASSSVTSTAAGPSRVYQQVVQQRLQVLSRSRDIMGSARGLMVIHGSGSRSQAVMFHRAVKAARLQLQQQAAALQASGQIQAAAAAGAPEGLQSGASAVHQPQPPTAGALEGAANASAQAEGGSKAVAAGAASSSSNAFAEAALARSSAPAASAAKSGTAAAADRGRAMPRPASAASLAAAAAQDSAAGEPAGMRSQKSVTVGQLARQDLTKRHSLLFGALQQQQQPQQPQPATQQQHGHRRSSMPGSSETSSKKGRHKHTASEGGAWFGSAALHGNAGCSAAAASAAGLPATVVAAAQPIAIDLKQLALVDNLERGMSAPNADVVLFSPPAGGARAFMGRGRQERAVSMSPGALALLDADDQLCLLNTAGGMSAEDEDNTLLGGGVLSWGRKGAADMMASFRENYPMKPIVRSIARFGQSFSRSLTRTPRSFRNQSALSPSVSGRYMDAAAAAAATEAHTDPTSAQGSVTEQTAGSVTATAAAAAAAAAGQGASSTAAAAEPAAAAPSECSLDRISFMLPGGCEATSGEQAAAAAAAAAAVVAAVEEPGTEPAAIATAVPVPVDQAIIPLAGSRLSSTRFSEEGSLDMQGAFLGGQMSLDSSMAHSFLAATLDARSPTASLPRRCSLSPAAPLTAAVAARAPGQNGWLPLCAPPAATAAELAKLPVGAHQLGGQGDTARASVGSSSARTSAFASTGGAAAAAAALLDHRTSKGSPDTAAAAAARGTGNRNGPFGAVMPSPSVRAAATAAAARAEEEGIGLPNGLWLQQSMSISNTTVTNILQLLSPTKGSQAATGADAGTADAAAAQLGSAGGSLELAQASSSRSLSGGLDALSPGESGPVRSSSTTAAGARSSSEAEADAGFAGSVQGAAAAGAAGDAGTAGDRRVSTSSPVVHTRDVSIIGWLPEVQSEAEADTAATAAAAAEVPVGQVTDGSSSSTQRAVSSAGALTVAASNNPSTAAAKKGLHSVAVSVPRSVAAAGSRRGRPTQLWLSPAQPEPGRHRQRHSSSDGGALPQTSRVPSAGGVSAARMGSSGVGGIGDSILERASSAAASSADQEFYVGSFWSPTGLAGQPGSRRQQQLQRGMLARSTSSMGRLDSLQDSLASDTPTAELDLAAAGVVSPPEAEALMVEASTAADAVVSRTCSSVPGHGGTMEVSYGGYESNRVSVDMAEGMLEGCLPADCSGDTWRGRRGTLQQGGASVLVRVHSGAMSGPKYSATAAKAGSTGASFSSIARAGGPSAAAADAAVAGGARPAGNYTWIAKAVVSRSPERPQPPQPQPQFDAFDEPHGEWYYAGTT